VIFAATDQAARGAFTAAENSNAFAVASYTDQANLAPKNILASVLYDYPRLVKVMVVMAVEDKLEVGKAYAMGVTDGVWRPTRSIQPSIQRSASTVKAKVASLAADIKAGKIKVPMLSKPKRWPKASTLNSTCRQVTIASGYRATSTLPDRNGRARSRPSVTPKDNSEVYEWPSMRS